MKLKIVLPIFIFLQACLWSHSISAYTEVISEFPDVIRGSKNIVIGTYTGYKLGKKENSLITRYVFEDVVLVTSKKITKTRKKYSLQIPGGIRITDTDENNSSLEVEGVDDLNDDTGVDATKKGKAKIYKRKGREVMRSLVNEGIPFKIEGPIGLVPEFVPGSRYIFIPTKKSASPISPYIFIIEDEKVYFSDMQPVVGFDENNNPLSGTSLLSRLNEESPVYTTDDGNPSVVLFSSEMEMESSQPAISLEHFINTISPMIGVRG